MFIFIYTPHIIQIYICIYISRLCKFLLVALPGNLHLSPVWQSMGGFVADVKIVKKALKVFAFLWLKLKKMLFLG